MIDIINREIKEFSEYSRNGYSGGLEGLRCSICDSKYSGDSKFMQLCPRCKANQLLITLLQAQIDEWEKQKVGFKDIDEFIVKEYNYLINKNKEIIKSLK